MRILVVGDVHGELGIGRLNTLINKKQPDLILQCGDLGFWPKSPLGQLSSIKLQGATLHFADGNHEDHQALQELVAGQGDKSPVELAPGIFYQPRASTLTLPDGRVVCFIGGAKSVDWQLRKQGMDVFIEELITADDMAALPETADIVISHTIPGRFRPDFGTDKLDDGLVPEGWDLSLDPCESLLTLAFERLRPSLWYFGHFHRFAQGETQDCKWTALGDVTSRDTSWIWLPPAEPMGQKDYEDLFNGR